jgi:hypothetical protein
VITITKTITITVITITNITIAITSRLGPNAHTYAHNPREASCRFRWKI